MNKKQKKMLLRIVATALMLVVLQLVETTGALRLALYLIVYLVIGGDILRKALRGILNRRVFDENFLMAIATVGAFVLAIHTKSGDYLEGIAVMLFYQIGELFQSYAVGKSRKNIAALMDIRPDYANVEVDGELQQVDPQEVAVGSVIVVQPGEKVPLDGVVLEGSSSLDTVALTGESIPRDVAAGDGIVSGCINLSGLLKVQTTKEFGESTVSKILDLVENASSRKSRAEDFIARFARVYTPAVCGSALALVLLPPLVRLLFLGLVPQWGIWAYRALIFLVVSCPCALVISVPLSFFAGLGGASKEGVLIKGSNYLETLAQVKCVVFDKTGTLTEGTFQVVGIHHNQIEEHRLLEYAALAECASNHPISKSLQRAYGGEIDRSRVGEIEEISGHGVVAMVDGQKVTIGNDKLMEKQHIDYQDCHSAGTVIHVAVDGAYVGHILISDVVKPHARAAVEALKALGVTRTIMLTGDRHRAAQQVAAELGVDEVQSELLPGDKVERVEQLLGDMRGGKVAFVGDGINDAPVLTRADVGIAMGAMGSDAAIEAADVVLMDDDPLQIVKGIKIARKCIGIVRQNIVLALVVKFGCLILSAIGLANMWLAIFADVGVMVLAVLNAIRALHVHDLSS